MNTKYWMISNRNETRRVRAGRRGHKALGGKLSPELSYWVADQGPLDRLESWTKTSLQDFKRALIAQSLYTGRDQVLGMSAGFKHFGKRRLGRSGLDCRYDVPDNVWDIDCSDLIPRGERNIHSAYFEAKEVLQLIKQLLRGVDRHELLQTSSLPLRRSTI